MAQEIAVQSYSSGLLGVVIVTDVSINALAFREITIVMKYNSLNALIRPLSRTPSGAVAFKRHA